MSLISKLKNAAVALEKSQSSLFTYPVEKQKKYIASFPEPRDDFERSYFQYKCQMKFNSPLINAALNAASLILILKYDRLKSFKNEKSKSAAVFFADGKPENIIPESLRASFDGISVVNDKNEAYTKDDSAFFKQLRKRYPFSWHFLLKCLLKIRFYSYELSKSEPRAVIVCNEYSFTSSVMTAYCEEKGIKHINVMHGEKLYFMRDSFFRFHKCFVWDEHYVNLLSELRAEKKQFAVDVPPSLKFTDGSNAEKSVEYTYYLGNESNDTLLTIMKALSRLKDSGKTVVIRPHPRYTDVSFVKNAAPGIETEDFRAVSIEDSLKRTENAVSLYSTVLNQAYNNGVNVVIDDLSDRKRYEKIKELKYVMLEKEHKLLSDVLGENL